MKGLELSKKYYLEFGKPMLEKDFPELLPLIAVGLCGSGSECLGFDDDISTDHDFEPAFCIFLPDEKTIDRRTEFLLERAYARLPEKFMGFSRSKISPVGGSRHGIIRMSDFFYKTTGSYDGTVSDEEALLIPEQSLLEATGGEVFFDGLGLFSSIREKLSYLPEDARLKKLAGHLLTMAQAGQYNYERCVARGEHGAAQLALCEFTKSALHTAFLLNKKYIPYYKWAFKALSSLPYLSSLHAPLTYLISSGNTEKEALQKKQIIEEISATVCNELRAQDLLADETNDLEACAYAVNDLISNANIRNMHILFAV